MAPAKRLLALMRSHSRHQVTSALRLWRVGWGGDGEGERKLGESAGQRGGIERVPSSAAGCLPVSSAAHLPAR